MSKPLHTRLPARFIFVVGKGGVGKTTTASELALALAAEAASVHLISTDPAHSLRDYFEQHATTPPEALVVEEFDARHYADAWFARIQPALVELVERGTYLDHADATSFLDLSIPGIDEVMAALRLVELSSTKAQRIIIDTAPTGHTLRMLESAKLLRSWTEAGRAMVGKAAAVAEQLMRTRVRFAAEAVLDELEQTAGRFEDVVLGEADFVVVTRAGHVVEAETQRLTAALEQRGLRVTEQPVARQSGQPARRAEQGNAAEWLSARHDRLVWVAGKGGVGKSTCAAALATWYAQTRSVCVVSTDPAGSLGEVFGKPVTRAPVQIAEQLFARQIDATAEFEALRQQYRDSVERIFESFGLENAARLDRDVAEKLFDFAPPGIDEIIALIEILDHAGDYDLTVIDSAPTGHFLRLLELPDIVLQWVHALLRLLLKYHAASSLDALGQDLLAFAKRLRQLEFDAAYVVTLPEPMVIAETRRLCDTLLRLQVPIAAVILNRADESDTGELRSVFPRQPIMRAPNIIAEPVGTSALHQFLTQWEIEEQSDE